jgi:hypothetical protein
VKRLGIRPNHEYCTGEKGTRGIVFCGTQGATTDCDDVSDMNKGNRPAINEEFDPDYSCLFDTFQLKCIPGSNQECPNERTIQRWLTQSKRFAYPSCSIGFSSHFSWNGFPVIGLQLTSEPAFPEPSSVELLANAGNVGTNAIIKRIAAVVAINGIF